MTPEALRTAALVIKLDQETVRLCGLLEAAGLKHLLLKGPALQRWLYPSELRSYGDIDLLVPQSQQPAALGLLADQGYADVALGATGLETAEHARTLVGADRVTVDLHTRLHTTSASGDVVWEVLSNQAQQLPLVGGKVPICGLIPQLLVVVLHAAQHGATEAKPLEDLRRAALLVTDDQLHLAAGLAAQTGAADSFAAGLRLDPGLATRLPDLVAQPANLLVQALASGGHQVPGLILLARAQSANRRRTLQILARAVWPTAGFLRIGNDPARSRRPGWIALARVKRLSYQAKHVKEALRMLRKLHRGG